jgi:titin
MPQGLAAPSTLTAMVQAGGVVHLTWSDVANETGYRIYQWNGTGWFVAGTVGANVTAFDVAGLVRPATYYFYVEAFNATERASTAWVSLALS